jgi:hypothetical protein
MARAWQRWHQLGGRVRPVLGDACLVGKGRRPAAAVRWDSNPPSGSSGVPGRHDEGAPTCNFTIPIVTARAHREPGVPGVIQTQCGPLWFQLLPSVDATLRLYPLVCRVVLSPPYRNASLTRHRIRRERWRGVGTCEPHRAYGDPVNAYTTEGWGELFLAEAGASAALGGLLFVAVSINLERIIALRSLPGAALGAIVLLVAVLMVSTFALVPGQPRWVLGAEVLVVGIAAWSILTAIWIRALRAPIPNQPRFVPVVSVVVTQAATLPVVVAGVSLLVGAGGGLYWLVPGVAFSLVVAVVNAWVLLVEVVR